ncbi:MAG: hypothetical protein JW965_08435 [Bacteroidales bacterium]|nr:hypothetical protein [Bacteroidales bacterium]
MENNEKIMSSEESLKIISDMINRTKTNIREASFHLLFWGWLIVVCSLSEYLLYTLTSMENPWLAWLLTIPGVFVSLIYGFVKGSKQTVYTYADRLYMWSWLGFLFAAIILFVFLGFEKRMYAVGPYILMLAAFPTFLSGVIIKFRPLIFGGISIWILSLVCFFAGPSIGPLAVPAAMITGYLIPGYMIKNNGFKNDTV